ncbi:hypothetical protein ANO14919_007390 [Xylariales sp. No.14919]|nr:hypothetical protein ANO14919_007390 [Xylariales sp. No.14919]
MSWAQGNEGGKLGIDQGCVLGGAATENNSKFYLECVQSVQNLKGLPPATVFTCGFDPLRDVGVEYASKLQKAGNEVVWRHYGDLTHGFLQMAPWSEDAMKAMKDVALLVKKFTN